jgi:hypothetical protein
MLLSTPLHDHPNGKANALIAAQMRNWILKDLGEGSVSPSR